jgi:hypothetical protein
LGILVLISVVLGEIAAAFAGGLDHVPNAFQVAPILSNTLSWIASQVDDAREPIECGLRKRVARAVDEFAVKHVRRFVAELKAPSAAEDNWIAVCIDVAFFHHVFLEALHVICSYLRSDVFVVWGLFYEVNRKNLTRKIG